VISNVIRNSNYHQVPAEGVEVELAEVAVEVVPDVLDAVVLAEVETELETVDEALPGRHCDMRI
jgi:hypothetical protein